MVTRGDVNETTYVGLEGGVGGVLRAGDEEGLRGREGRGTVEQIEELGLTVGRVGAEITEVAAELIGDGGGAVGVGVD